MDTPPKMKPTTLYRSMKQALAQAIEEDDPKDLQLAYCRGLLLEDRWKFLAVFEKMRKDARETERRRQERKREHKKQKEKQQGTATKRMMEDESTDKCIKICQDLIKKLTEA